ncbi:hypothetical protein Y1Q_0002731 [Alligator mississippiensis]|uniref:Uncharacterized protein n=1 Tax=Alligator mississippiensis TaxID=8496 RepID=A0A151NZ68_ALLMI|nr:hypothetical protein Y1Q_0002731 [Alligator mississippiensis]
MLVKLYGQVLSWQHKLLICCHGFGQNKSFYYFLGIEQTGRYSSLSDNHGSRGLDNLKTQPNNYIIQATECKKPMIWGNLCLPRLNHQRKTAFSHHLCGTYLDKDKQCS